MAWSSNWSEKKIIQHNYFEANHAWFPGGTYFYLYHFDPANEGYDNDFIYCLNLSANICVCSFLA